MSNASPAPASPAPGRPAPGSLSPGSLAPGSLAPGLLAPGSGVWVTVVPGPPPAGAAALRHVVFVGEQGIDPGLEFDGLDASADHAVAFDADGHVVATARLLDPGETAETTGATEKAGAAWAAGAIGKIGRVAVRPDVRTTGLGVAVTRALEARASVRGLTAVTLHAQTYVEGFYLRQGYASHGDHFVVAGIEHVEMRKDLLPDLRAAGDADSEALIRLIDDAWAAYPGCVLDVDAEEPWLRAPASAYRPDLGGYDGRLWVVPALDGGLLASVAIRQLTGTSAEAGGGAEAGGSGTDIAVELKSLYVDAGARRRGLGAKLVHVVEREARRRGAERVRLWSDTRFTEAHALYDRLGYHDTGRTRQLHDLSDTTEREFVRTPDRRAPAAAQAS